MLAIDELKKGSLYFRFVRNVKQAFCAERQGMVFGLRGVGETSQQQTVLSIDRSSRSGVILANLQVNGKLAVLILDTSPNVTILSPEISGLSPGRLPRCSASKGNRIRGRWSLGKGDPTFGTTVWTDRRVLIADTKRPSGVLWQKIDGILSQDILDEFKYVEIDLEDKCLALGSE